MNNSALKLRGRMMAAFDNDDPTAWTSWEDEAEALLQRANKQGNGPEADVAWYMSELCRARGGMAAAFVDMRAKRYLNAWCTLEQVEIATAGLQRNPFLDEPSLHVSRLETMVGRWQSLFPYRLFGSPELIVRREDCSICGRRFGPFGTCGHEPGRVYSGTMCVRMARDMEFVGISIVTNPVQKFSVLLPDPDPSDYSLVDYATNLAGGPFAFWDVERTIELVPHATHSGHLEGSRCPCGSARTYRSCCLELPGVRREHWSFRFDAPASAPGTSKVSSGQCG